MSITNLAEQIFANPAELPALVAALNDADAGALVDYLKAEADRHWWINANRSLELAGLIVQVGQARRNIWQVALGTMARGDALKLIGRTEDAWETLGEAGELFQSIGEQIGWARTRIGRLMLCVDLNRVAETLADAERARVIFSRNDLREKLLVLDLNTAIVHNQLGEQQRSLTLYLSALEIAETLGDAGQRWIGPLCTNIGNVYDMLGDFRQALTYHERARTMFIKRDESSALAIVDLNIANLAMAQGHYRHALDLFHRIHDLKLSEQLFLDAAYIERDMVECYLLLNRYAEARELTQTVMARFHSFSAAYEEALALLHLATAEAELSNFTAAQAALDQAEPMLAALGSEAWLAIARLRRGRIALQQGDPATAARAATAAAAYFSASGQPVEHASACLLLGQAFLAEQNADAATAATAALSVAQRSNVPALRYNAHLLLGRIAEAQQNPTRALRRYRAAAATVERVQRGLTITLRPGFLEDKGEALRALIALNLRQGRVACAFESLERAKSQIMLGYLANREQLRWVQTDLRSRELIDELNRLRDEHQWFYRLAHEHSADEHSRPSIFDQQQALAEVARRERRMRTITEQLYLHSGAAHSAEQVAVPPIDHIQRRLGDDTLLIEFYNDGAHIWAFTLDASELEVYQLPTSIAAVNQLLNQLQLNLAAALKAGSLSPLIPSLTAIMQRIVQRLYAALLQPLAPRLRDHRRLVIVPYGVLHYLPFHLLHDGSTYLIERHEMVVLPAAGLITRNSLRRPPGALVLAHSLNGRLPQTLAEAHILQGLFGGTICRNEAAGRAALYAQPSQILHIAAHGEHRLDQPDLSYIQLADGQLYTDDLLQHDLSYELVTLSACETGRANIAAGDEPIGLGRGVLYAGAGAIISSMWRVTDDSTVILMQRIYQALAGGASKAAALRAAQRELIDQAPQPHPAFWGAFQLVGNAEPLSNLAALNNKGG
jgi:CHAT domain-containing protein/tetratricopeptide (TPR) repeat protein